MNAALLLLFSKTSSVDSFFFFVHQKWKTLAYVHNIRVASVNRATTEIRFPKFVFSENAKYTVLLFIYFFDKATYLLHYDFPYFLQEALLEISKVDDFLDGNLRNKSIHSLKFI